jgi:hypothetical protein
MSQQVQDTIARPLVGTLVLLLCIKAHGTHSNIALIAEHALLSYRVSDGETCETNKLR